MEPVEIDIRLKQNVDTESEKAVQAVNNISTAGKDAVQAAKTAVQEQENVIKQIESDLASIEQKLKQTSTSNAKSQLTEELTATKQALEEEKAALSDYKLKLDEVAQSSGAFGNSVQASGQNIGESFDSISLSGKAAIQAAKSAVQEQVELIKSIENDVKSIQKQVDNSAPGNSKEQLTLELQSAKQALEEEKAALTGYKAKVDEATQANASLTSRIQVIVSEMSALEAAGGKDSAAYDNLKQKAVELITEQDRLKQTYSTLKQSIDENNGSVEVAAEKHVRLRTQVMEAKQALSEMEMAGKRGTPEYLAQSKVLGELNDQMQDTNQQAKILADDQKGFKAVAGAVSILTGTMTAGVGVAAAFGAKDEDLAKIQTRLQAVMAITIGLEQVANALDKDQYFNVVLVTKAKQGWATAQTFLNTQLGLSVGLSKALMIGGIGLLIAGIGTLIYALTALSSAHKDAAKDAKEFGDKAADSFSKPMAQIESLSDKWNGLGDNLKEKKKFVDDNKEAFKTLGVEINTVADAENLLVANKASFIESIIAKAKAAAGMELASEKYKKAMQVMLEAEKMPKTVEINTSQGGGTTGGGMMVKTTVKNSAYYDLVKQHDDYIAEGDRYVRASTEQSKKEDQILAKANIEKYKPDPKKTRTKAVKEQYDAEKAIQKLILDIHDETSKLLIAQQEDSLNKRLQQIEQEKQLEAQKITEKEQAIIVAYNRAHKDDKGFKPLAVTADAYNAAHKNDAGFTPKTTEQVVTDSLTTIDTSKDKKVMKQRNDELLALNAAYQAKTAYATKEWGDKMTDLAGELADQRIKIEDEWGKKIKQIETQAQAWEEQAAIETDTTKKQQLLDQAAYLRAGATADKVERAKRVSDVTLGYIEETEAYKTSVSDQYNLGKELNDKLVNQVKTRVAAEIAAGKLTQEDAKKILTEVDKSQAVKVSGSLSDYISSIGKLKKAKEDLAKAKVSGDLEGAKKASDDIANLTTTVETYGQKLQNVFSTASDYANQAVGLLDAISTEEGDAASSAAKSIGTIMNIAGNAVNSLAKGDYVGAAIGVVTGTLTAIFSAEKAHQQALAAIAKAKADTQKEYNDLLMKQNDLLEKAENIFGTSKLTQANAYVAQIAAYGKAKDDAVKALSSATVQTGSHKTGLFGWGGEKADYSALLGQYPALIDAQGNLNSELATSILVNEKLNDSSKSALQSALDYTEEYQTALGSLKSYLSDIFGSLSDDLMTVIFDNLDSSKDAVDDFQDYVGNAMKKMISDLGQKIFFAQMFSDLSDKVLGIYKDTSLSNQEKTAQVTAAMGTFYNGIGQATSDATKFINDMYGSIKTTTGIDLSSSTERTGTTKGIATASQDSMDEYNGNIYALRMVSADSRNYIREQLLILKTVTGQLDRIADNTEYCKFLEDIKKFLEDMNVKGIKVKV